MTKPTSPRQARLLRRIRITGWTALSLLLSTIAGFATWAYSPYPSDAEAVVAVFSREDVVASADAHLVVLTPADSAVPRRDEALLFLPGARVEPDAYAGTFAALVAESGMTVVIPRPVANLALLDWRSLEDFQALSPVPITAVGGHSLGGVKACALATDERVSSLILFASYCIDDLSTSNLRVLTVSAERDGLTQQADIDNAAAVLPSTAVFHELAGANHSSFGDYGPQSGDKEASVGRDIIVDELTQVLAGFLADQATEG